MNNKLSIIRQALQVLLKRNMVERHQAPMLLLQI
jgi:predicted transcriptional regulator